MPIIPATGRRHWQENQEFQSNLGYTNRSCFKSKQNNNKIMRISVQKLRD